MSQLQKTSIHPLYKNFKTARCTDFCGWDLPIQFYGIQREHDAVRNQAGLFDVSHMGEFWVEGQYAESYLQRLLTNDVSRLSDGQAQYNLMCYPDGGVVDDLLVYRITRDQYLIVVNASNIEKDFAWMYEHLIGDVNLENRSAQTGLLALQGPLAETILSTLTYASLSSLSPFYFLNNITVAGKTALVSRTGYTGEDGFEIYVNTADAPYVWEAILQAGEPLGLIPAGLGARDTLRFEARLPLYGQELSPQITPLEAGLSIFVKLNKEGGFIGSDALIKQKESGVPRKLVGIEMIDRGIPRSHYPVFSGEEQIGEVTTGTQSPTLKRNLGLALIKSEYAELGTELLVEIRGKKLKAIVVKTPFYKKQAK